MNSDYQIALTSVAFDNSYKNVLRFDNRSEQEAYFDVNTLFYNAVDVNFNVGSLYATNVVYDCLPTDSINELLNKNYCIVKDNTSTKTLNYYYYFVTNAVQDCGNRIKMSLELDIFQTYYIDLQFGECMINKAHLNRFIDNGDGTVSFDGSVNSKLFEREDIQNVAKRMTKRVVKQPYTFDNSAIQQWFEDNILGWAYVFVDPYTNFNIKSPENADITNYKISSDINYGNASEDADQLNRWGTMPNQLGVICYPIYKTTQTNTRSKLRFVAPNNELIINNIAMQDFFELNSGNEKVFSIKFSTVNPFAQLPNADDLYIDSNGNLCIPSTILSEHWGHRASDTYDMYAFKTGGTGGVIRIKYQRTHQSIVYNSDKKFTFYKSDIISSNKNPIYNPKLLANDYCELIISDETEAGYSYDMQKLNSNTLKILYTEPLLAGISKKYIRIKPENNSGIYIEDVSKSFLGFIGSNDTSYNLATSAFQAMLAQNKNYFLQNSINRGFSAIRDTLGNVASGDVAQMAIGGIGSGLNQIKSLITEGLTIDNLKSAPSKIQLAQGEIMFNTMITDVGIVVEEYDILPNEKEIINDYMCLYGFTYNRMDNVKNVDNIRKYYNYVKANIETISGINISEQVHAKFRQCFAEGVRFWNTDTFSYQLENYENWLDTAQINIDYEGEDSLTITYNGEEQNRQFNASINGVIDLATTEGKTLDVNASVIPYNPMEEFRVLIQRTSGQLHKAQILYTNCSSVNLTVTIT